MTDFMSALGTGISWGAGSAAAVYGIAVAFEKDSKPEARREIAQFLASAQRGFDITLLSRHVKQAFERLLGPSRFGLPRVSSSLAITMIFFIITELPLFLFQAEETAATDNQDPYWLKLMTAIMLPTITACVPDYVSL
ncbi:hypothetical protein [Acidisphaera sp. S103]|uniref:hypothetical protein n=1 Tax=Acidisphaera sp. S103 TaxID=1747223 RepID=UPI00131D3B99|nr:hypothetical protein [Acidisphaera sp. S103]